MFRIILTLTILTSLVSNIDSYAQQMIRLEDKNEIICYADFTDKGTRILPISKSGTNNRTQSTATFEVEYIGFTPQAEAAFQAAVDIWSELISSPVPIRIRASWESLDAGVLGSAIFGDAFGNFREAQALNTFYPIALAEKMAARNFNDDEPDIIASFSSNANWYFGTDGQPSNGQFDLVSVVLHEIGHGLGFVDSFDFDENTEIGSFGFGTTGGETFSIIYDRYVENSTADTLVVDFTNPSSELGTELTSNDLFYNSVVATDENTERPRIFAPTPWNPGSSIAHLNEGTYPSGTPNSLMTPQIAMSEVMQDPGPITLNILGDLGWEFLYITPDRPNSEGPTASEYPVVAQVEGDNDVAPGSVMLHYSLDNFASDENVVEMLPTGNPHEYAANIPSTGVPDTYFYYIEAGDVKGRSFNYPGLAPEFASSFETTSDDAASPEITHTPPGFIRDTDTELILEAIIKDFLPLSEIRVDYSIAGGANQSAIMTLINDVDSVYQTTIDISAAGLSEGDIIAYSITAVDESANLNTSTLPASGTFELEVISLLPTAPLYFNNFNEPTDDFFSSESFRITTPSGFTDGAIHSDHPYADGSGANDESNYTFELRVPILIDASDAFISFDEIVLVEPGEAGTVFGDDQFWDYVIVEGSTDGGVTWLPFTNGYDARENTDWLQLYNGAINTDNNSTAVGTPGLFRSRSINMLSNGNFQNGDEVLIRFRLFADQAAHGWGWAMDNLAIQIDNTPPEIFHDHFDITSDNNIDLMAEISDNRLVESVDVVWLVNDVLQDTVSFDISAPDQQVNTNTSLNIEGASDGSIVYYRYEAFDPDGNVSFLPGEDEFFTVLVSGTKNAVTSYSNNFDTPTDDFFGNFFAIEQPTGFNSPGIHSRHPYPVSFGVNDDSDFTYTLLTPITVAATNARLAFDEVVLVEPSLGGAFGSPAFNDFVIVEGSSDGGDTWIAFEDGYDSGDDNEWLTTFGSGEGSEALYRYRVVDLTQSRDFSAGNEILIRFRLFSNNAINGWGWAIDNLEIQTDAIITSLPSVLDTHDFKVFPNPLVSDRLSISFDQTSNLEQLSIELLDLNGRLKSKVHVENSSETLFQLKLDHIESGMYVLKISTGTDFVTQRIIKP